MKKWMSMMLAVLLCFTMACGALAEDPVSTKDSMTIVIDREPVSLDPVDVFVNVKSMIDNCIYDTLLKVDTEGNVVANLAESWTKVDDLTWQFTLREGVYFHDGTPLQPSDVLYSLRRVQESSVTAQKASFLDLDNSSYEGNVITLKLVEPYAFVEAQLSNPQFAIVSEAIVTAAGEEYGREPIGTGPYKFVSWTAGDRIEVTRNDDYWGHKSILKDLTFRVITESASRTIELESGGVDLVLAISTNDAERIAENPDTKMLSRSSNSLRYIGLNCSKPELSDVRVRQALFHATDTEVLREILYGLTTSGPATSCVPEGMIGINNDLTPYEYDPQKARDLLAEAGYADGLEIEFMYLANSTNNMLAELLQAMWGEVGVTLVLQPMESGALSTALNKGEHMICSAGTTFSLGEAGEGLYNMFSLESQGSSANRTYLTDTAVDELLQKIVVTSDAQERAQMVYDVQALIHAQAPMIYLASQYTNAGARANLEGFNLGMHTNYDFTTCYFK